MVLRNIKKLKMKSNSISTKFIVVLNLSFFLTVNCLHLTKSSQLLHLSNVEPNNASDSSVVKGSIPSLFPPKPDPAVITQQLQSTIQNVIKALNNTLSSLNSNSTSFTNILGSVKNLTSSVINKSRLEELENISANFSEMLKISEEAHSLLKFHSIENENSSKLLSDQTEGAFRDFQKTIADLKSFTTGHNSSSTGTLKKRTGIADISGFIPNENMKWQTSEGTFVDITNHVPVRKGRRPQSNRRQDGFQKIMDKMTDFHSMVDEKVHKSIAEAREMLVDTARQGSEFMKNQTTGFMHEIKRVFSSFSNPIKNFFDGVRKGAPTAVITA